jgi:4-aminobutyrate aminotransferase
LMIGIQFDSGDTAEAVQWACFERGLLVLEAGDDVVRLCPPLVVSESDINTCVRIFSEAVEEVARDPRAAFTRAKKWEQIDDGEVAG